MTAHDRVGRNERTTAMVRQVALGASKIVVSEFVFGAGSIGGVGVSSSTRGLGLDAPEAEERLDEGWALSITMIDTADSYGGGQSEVTVGGWLRDRQPAGMVVGSKVGLVSNPTEPTAATCLTSGSRSS